MKNEICEKCPFYQMRKWSHRYKPSGYHAVGMTHAYGYCLKHESRCSEVAKCDGKEKI